MTAKEYFEHNYDGFGIERDTSEHASANDRHGVGDLFSPHSEYMSIKYNDEFIMLMDWKVSRHPIKQQLTFNYTLDVSANDLNRRAMTFPKMKHF